MKKEKYIEFYLKSIAPSQREFMSKDAREGKRISPVWMPDDIGTKNFSESDGTAYLRNMK